MGAHPLSNEELDELRANVAARGEAIDNYEPIARLLATVEILRVNLRDQVAIKQKLHDEYVDARGLLQEHQDAHGHQLQQRPHDWGLRAPDDPIRIADAWRGRRDAFLSRHP